MKAERASTHHLGRDPREVLSVPAEDGLPVSSEATVYAGLTTRSANVIGVRLVAGLMGHRTVIGAAGIPAGFDGICVIASGVVADAWHVEAWDNPPPGVDPAADLKLTVALGIRQCCSGFAVEVPADLQARIPNLPAASAAGDLSPVLPFGRDQGAYRVLTDTGAPLSFTVEPGERILRLVLDPLDATDMNVVGFPGAAASLVLPPVRAEILPNGNAAGPATITVGFADYGLLELVR